MRSMTSGRTCPCDGASYEFCCSLGNGLVVQRAPAAAMRTGLGLEWVAECKGWDRPRPKAARTRFPATVPGAERVERETAYMPVAASAPEPTMRQERQSGMEWNILLRINDDVRSGSECDPLTLCILPPASLHTMSATIDADPAANADPSDSGASPSTDPVLAHAYRQPIPIHNAQPGSPSLCSSPISIALLTDTQLPSSPQNNTPAEEPPVHSFARHPRARNAHSKSITTAAGRDTHGVRFIHILSLSDDD
jgi:hypothetical protein